MGLRVQPAEQQTVAAVLRFANLPKVETKAQGEECFGPWRDTLDTYQQAHGLARGWLARIAPDQPLSAVRTGRIAVRREVANALPANVNVQMAFRNEQLHYDYFYDDVQGAVVHAIALLLAKDRGLTDLLHRCGWCRNFYLVATGKRGRRNDAFCSKACSTKYAREHDKERVRKYRQDQKRKARKA